ncbi:hypothetical protein JG688_00015070, partial [Phytophthora aleatoria]
KEPEKKPKLPLPLPPPFHLITKAPNIDEVWVIHDRAHYEKTNEAYLGQWCDEKHRFCATWVWATTLFLWTDSARKCYVLTSGKISSATSHTISSTRAFRPRTRLPRAVHPFSRQFELRVTLLAIPA